MGSNHPRVVAARKWLERHFRVDLHPGRFEPHREGRRQGVYFYYAWSVAQALRDTVGTILSTPKGKIAWVELLARELLLRQHRNGAWINPCDFMHVPSVTNWNLVCYEE